MFQFRRLFLVGLLIAAAALVLAAVSRDDRSLESAWDRTPPPVVHVDHAAFFPETLKTGPEVTRACLRCHPKAAEEMMRTSHWTWAGQKVKLPGRDEVMQVGKRNLINNFCIHAGPNIKTCSSCHAGYGWEDSSFDFAQEDHVDCLVCHDRSGMYQKGQAGNPKPEVDLMTVARSVGRPTRVNCGQCHFKGGGGDAVKHGDMDGSLYFPSQRIDVHMGQYGMECVDCHRTVDHQIPGCAMSVCIERRMRVNCTDCHSERPHHHERLDAHTQTVACQTCHIPRMAIDVATKMEWDWSTAGQDGRPDDPHVYLKAKGSFQYAQNIRPEYYWYNGRAYRYLTGDKIDPTQVVQINRPLGGPGDPEAKIWPFKVHRGKQIYDKRLLHLLAPQTAGPGGYWAEFDWDKACRLGSQAIGLPYSGEYDFVATEMYWPLSHMVQPAEKALQCTDCHGEHGGFDWQALGYEGDPAFRGDRWRLELVRGTKGESR